MANKTFTKGSGVYTCNCCGRKTRDLDGDAANVRLCAECYELGGIYNAFQDEGIEELINQGYVKDVIYLQNKLNEKGIEMDGDTEEMLEAMLECDDVSVEQKEEIKKLLGGQ